MSPIDQPQAAAPAPQQAAICIAPQGDGTFMVYAEGSEPQGEALELDAALEQVRSMLGADNAAAPDGKAEAEALFVGGFDGVRSPLNRG